MLRYCVTKDPKSKKNQTVESNFDIIAAKYPIVAELKVIYDEFYDALMGGVVGTMDCFIEQYKNSAAKGFVDGITKDIAAVNNAVSYTESNGFVEGNNNKFKLIKRILYGRAKLDTLFKKCWLAFKVHLDDFNLDSLFINTST